MTYKKIILLALTMTLLTVSVSHAIPTLQLGIEHGYYYQPTQTILSTDQQFTLSAYLIPDDKKDLALLTDWYYISAAVTPAVGIPGKDLGSFLFNGNKFNVTGDMTYGTPPISMYLGQTLISDLDQTFDPGDLSKHGIFDTYFVQFAFQFDVNKKATAYNTADNPSAGPTPNPNGTMYYQSFEVDTRLLTFGTEGYEIHFDLYNSSNTPITEKYCTGSGNNRQCVEVAGYDIDINTFAPFSHDAQSDPPPPPPVPEPTTMLLLGLGLVGLAGIGRKIKN